MSHYLIGKLLFYNIYYIVYYPVSSWELPGNEPHKEEAFMLWILSIVVLLFAFGGWLILMGMISGTMFRSDTNPLPEHLCEVLIAGGLVMMTPLLACALVALTTTGLWLAMLVGLRDEFFPSTRQYDAGLACV